MVSISNTKTVTGSHNIVLQADVLFEEADYSKMDLLVLPGGMRERFIWENIQGFADFCRILQLRGRKWQLSVQLQVCWEHWGF